MKRNGGELGQTVVMVHTDEPPWNWLRPRELASESPGCPVKAAAR